MLGFTLSFGQDILKEYGYALYGGINLSSFDKDTIQTSATPGIHIGGAIEIPITEKFSIQPGLELSMKGSKTDRLIIDKFKDITTIDGDGNPTTITVPDTAKALHQKGVNERLLYIQIPVLAYYHFNVGTGKLFVSGGPYLGLGIFSYASEKDATGKSAPFYAKEYKQMDFGVQVKAGYELSSGWFVSVGYDYGLSDISKSVFPDHKTKNSSLLFSIGRKVWGY